MRLDDSGAPTHRYLWGQAVDQILADEIVDGGGAEDVLWPLTDHQNTVRDLAVYDEVLDETSVANHIAYDAFGNVLSETNAAVDHLFGYTGRPFDETTGLQNNLHRWYDASVGRWLSEDPIGIEGGDANLYRAVHNSPGNEVDPSGLNPNQTGAKDLDELIDIIRDIERRLEEKLGLRSPSRMETAKALLAEMLEHRDAGSNHYYVFSEKDNRWIDVRHLIESARLTGGIWEWFARSATFVVGTIFEIGQGVPGMSRDSRASAGGEEDWYSNSLGARFGSKYLGKGNPYSRSPLSEVLEKYLKGLGVGEKERSKFLKDLPRSEEEWQKWKIDDGGRGLLDREGAKVRPKDPPPHKAETYTDIIITTGPIMFFPK